MQAAPIYIHVAPESVLPDVVFQPSKIIVVLDAAVSPAWQGLVSDWIVHTGCLYMMAWGVDCSSWDDSVDCANLEQFDYGEIPDDRFVMTTWHEGEPLDDVFWYAKVCAAHPVVDLAQTVILHISASSRRQELLGRYTAAGIDLAMA
jgi:hypothetical protein